MAWHQRWAILLVLRFILEKLKPVYIWFTGFFIFRLDGFNLNQAVKGDILFHSSIGGGTYKAIFALILRCSAPKIL
jgi:hypothetical protein